VSAPSDPPVAVARPRHDLRLLGAIFVGGMAGALARAGLEQAWPVRAGQWPWTTFAINIAGAFLLGLLATRLQERLPLSRYRRPLLGTGLCGALTTFSTLQVEVLDLLDDHDAGLAVGYAAASIVAGFAAVLVATNLVRRVGLTR
jgi:CrcB protein